MNKSEKQALRASALADLDGLIKRFDRSGCYRTVKWLKFIQNNITKEYPSDYSKDRLEVYIQYRTDLREKYGAYAEECDSILFMIIKALWNKGIADYNNAIKETEPLLDKWITTRKNIAKMSELGKNDISDVARYYLNCYIYLITIEGVYSPWIKVLFGMLCEYHSVPYSRAEIEELKLPDIKKLMLNSDKRFSVIFDGYWDELRNAIAHGDVSYDEATKKMRFKHIWKGETKMDESLNIEEFQKYLENAGNFVDVCTDRFVLLRLEAYRGLFES